MKKLSKKRLPGLALLAPCLFGLAAVGCHSFKVSRCVSPQITGFVVDAVTLRPIQGVKVSRLDPGDAKPSMEPMKGSQVLQQDPFAHTDLRGHFVLESERSLIAFGKAGWYSVSVSFEHPSYRRLSTSYTVKTATNTVEGVPVIHTGNVMMTAR